MALNIDDRRVCGGLELDEGEDRSIPLKMTNTQAADILYRKSRKTRYRTGHSIFKFRLTMKDIKLREIKTV